MPDREIEEFVLIKGKISENIEALLVLIQDSENQGMKDSSSHMYNQLLAIADELDISETYEELEEVIFQAKEIEHNIEAWLSTRGQNSFELSWPNIQPYL